MSPPALAATFVYVSNSDDGNIAIYSMRPDGTLKAGDKVDAANAVMPMAVSPDKRFLIAAVRSKPYEAYTYSIDKKSGALKLIGKGPLAESYPYITIDATGRYLLGASYGANQVGVNPIGQSLMATPAISEGTIVFRTRTRLVAVAREAWPRTRKGEVDRVASEALARP